MQSRYPRLMRCLSIRPRFLIRQRRDLETARIRLATTTTIKLRKTTPLEPPIFICFSLPRRLLFSPRVDKLKPLHRRKSNRPRSTPAQSHTSRPQSLCAKTSRRATASKAFEGRCSAERRVCAPARVLLAKFGACLGIDLLGAETAGICCSNHAHALDRVTISDFLLFLAKRHAVLRFADFGHGSCFLGLSSTSSTALTRRLLIGYRECASTGFLVGWHFDEFVETAFTFFTKVHANVGGVRVGMCVHACGKNDLCRYNAQSLFPEIRALILDDVAMIQVTFVP
ncbi:hypothetical protein CUC08_Gglean007783 [Alternaria sp. MG1]|nr:hypothetical protein CUC08_Gglean007783 [Alternaria sp. MG1]